MSDDSAAIRESLAASSEHYRRVAEANGGDPMPPAGDDELDESLCKFCGENEHEPNVPWCDNTACRNAAALEQST